MVPRVGRVDLGVGGEPAEHRARRVAGLVEAEAQQHHHAERDDEEDDDEPGQSLEGVAHRSVGRRGLSPRRRQTSGSRTGPGRRAAIGAVDPSGSASVADALHVGVADDAPRRPDERDVVALLGERPVDVLGGGVRLGVVGGPAGRVEVGVDRRVAEAAEVQRQLAVGLGRVGVPPEVLLVDADAGVLAPQERLELGGAEERRG